MAGILLRNCRRLCLLQQEIQILSFPLLKYCNSADKSEKEVDAPDHPSTLYIDTSAHYAIGKKSAVKQLQGLFGLSPPIATDIVARHKNLCSVTGKTILTNYTLLKNEGISNSIMLAYPDILAQRNMVMKIKTLNQLRHNIRDTAPLLSLGMNQLEWFVNKLLVERTRLRHTAALFEVPLVQACSFLVSRPFLQKITMTKLETNLKLLTGFGIKVQEIKNDFWVLQYNSESIKERLETANMLNIDKLKTWMVRSNPKIFNTYVQRISENKLLLGENSICDHLAKRLECSDYEMKLILSKNPALLNKSVKRMNDIIDCVINAGFTPRHIVRNPKILLHSIETTRKRLKELESLEVKVDSLHILTKSQRVYMHFYDNLVKSNMSKVKDTN